MSPKVIVYNSVSLDGAIKDFDVNIQLHYAIAGRLGADALLAGSITAKTGIEMFLEKVPPEERGDFSKPAIDPQDKRPWWIIVDSKGVMQGLMHVHRKSGYAKDVIALVSNSTPKAYLDYLSERNYDFIVAGEDRVDLRFALEELNRRYGIKTVMTDTGGVLASALFEQNLVDELHLLIAPEIVGENAVNLFRNVGKTLRLQLLKSEVVEDNHVLLVYRALKN